MDSTGRLVIGWSNIEDGQEYLAITFNSMSPIGNLEDGFYSTKIQL